MSKFFDWLMTDGDWEAMQRIALYKKLGKKLESMSDKEIQEEIETLQNVIKKRKR